MIQTLKLTDIEEIIKDLIHKEVGKRLDGQNTKLDEILKKLNNGVAHKNQFQVPVSQLVFGEQKFKRNERVRLTEIPVRTWANPSDKFKYIRIDMQNNGVSVPLTHVFTLDDVFEVKRGWKSKPGTTRTIPNCLIVKRIRDGMWFRLEEKYLTRV